MDGTRQYFDAWLKGQEALFEGFLDNARKTQQLFLGQQTPAFTGDLAGFNNLYSSWSKAVQDSLAATEKADLEAVRDNLSRVLGGSNIYRKLYEIWLPLMKAAHEKSLDAASLKTLVDPSKYKAVIDGVFRFDTEAVKLMLNETAQLFELCCGSSQQFTKPWTEATKTGLGAVPHFAEGHPESFIKIFHSIFNAFDNTFGRIFHVPPVGKDREKIELLLRCLDDLSVYAVKHTEYQHAIYLTGLTAMEKVIESMAEKVKSGEEIKKFDHFFDNWIDVSEQAYFQLFQTEEFARLQGELLDAGLKARMHLFKVMEMHLYDLPIVLRTEMDDHYKTVYDLKKKVSKLEKQLREAAV